MKQILLAAALLASTITLHAQEDAKDEEYELRGTEKYGYIITEKGDKVEGIVKLKGTPETPWVNQKKVKFIAKADIDPEKKRQKLKVWDTDDLKEYVAFEDGVERHFRLVKYANMREGIVNQSGSGLGGKLKGIKNMSTTRHMAEVMVDGKISVFRLYGYPAAVAIGEDDVRRAESDEKNIIAHPTLLVQKGDDRVQELQAGDIKELTKDCKMVQEKIEAAGYQSYDPEKQDKKRSGMGKLMKNEVDRVSSSLLEMSKEIFGDYNANCK